MIKFNSNTHNVGNNTASNLPVAILAPVLALISIFSLGVFVNNSPVLNSSNKAYAQSTIPDFCTTSRIPKGIDCNPFCFGAHNTDCPIFCLDDIDFECQPFCDEEINDYSNAIHSSSSSFSSSSSSSSEVSSSSSEESSSSSSYSSNPSFECPPDKVEEPQTGRAKSNKKSSSSTSTSSSSNSSDAANVARSEVVNKIYTSLELTPNTDCGDFDDVDEDNQFYTQITTFKCNGIIGGVDGKNFKPDQLTSNGEYVKMLINVLSDKDSKFEDISGTENPYSDITSDSPFYNQILSAYKYEVFPTEPANVLGDEFRSGDLITMKDLQASIQKAASIV